MELTAERLRKLVCYDPATGHFTNVAPRKKVRVGERAGTIDKESGYVVLCIDRKRHYGHRLAFLYMTGEWPRFLVDHKNGIRSNNAFENLRDAPRVINQQNMRSASKASSSGLLGAFRKRNKWESRIKVMGETIRLGIFKTPEKAHAAYIAAKRTYHAGCTI